METKDKRRARPKAGRKPKPNKEDWGQITCVLRLETIRALREGAGSNRFGEFLQAHLDRYPLPTKEEYSVASKHPKVIVTYPSAAKHADRRLEKLSPEDRKFLKEYIKLAKQDSKKKHDVPGKDLRG